MQDRIAHYADGNWSLGESVSDYLHTHDTTLAWPTVLFYILFGLALAFGLFAIIRSCIGVVPPWEDAVVTRLSKFHKVRGAGLFWKWPVIDSVVEYVDRRVRSTTLTAESSLTLDTVAVSIETVIYWQVVDVVAAVLRTSDYEDAIEQAALVCIRQIVGSTSLTTLLSDREAVDLKMMVAINERAKTWGILVTSVDIKDVTIPRELEEVMSRQAQAERERDARVTLASAEVLVAEKTVDAAKLYDAHPTALRLRQMALTFEIGKTSNTILLPAEMLGSLSGTHNPLLGGLSGLNGSNTALLAAGAKV